MKKLVAIAALAVGLMIGNVANAAGIDIFLTQTTGTDWELTATSNSGANLGALNLILSGLTNVVFNAPGNPGVDGSLSLLALDGVDSGRHFLIVQNSAVGVSIAGPGNALGSVNVLLASFSGPTGPVSLQDTSEYGGLDNGVFLADGNATFDYSINVVPIPVPEPASMVLLGLGLAALGMVRRSA